MTCCHHYIPTDGADTAFSVDVSAITFGRGCMAELGVAVASLGLTTVVVFTDSTIRSLPPFDIAMKSLHAAGIEVEIFDEVMIEPTDSSFRSAIQFARERQPEGYISIGGGSVIDTCKAANLYSRYPAEFDTYVNAPVGAGTPVPGALLPHIACPTTSGTGSECTGIAIFDYVSLHAKTGIASRHLRPTRALIDADWTRHMPKMVLACSAFDVLSHALESYTARPYTRRPYTHGNDRPLSQGANPWSDMGCAKALQLLGEFMERAVNSADDDDAREQVMWASTLAGIAFGNSGVHLPHGMSYAVAGGVRDFHAPDYPDYKPMVPHGMSVIVNAPAVFRATAGTAPERHLEAAGWLGATTSGADAQDGGEILSGKIVELMRNTAMPLGLEAVGYSAADLDTLTRSASLQKRLLDNAPLEATDDVLRSLFAGAMSYA